MKLSTALAFAMISAATAQLGDLPTCAKSCATDAIPASCGVDVACICESGTFIADVACCIVGVCTEEEQEETLKAADAICSAGGVTGLPTTVACTTGASATGNATKTATATGTDTSSTASSKSTSTSSSTNKATSATSAASGTSATSATDATATSTATGAAAAIQNKEASFMAAAAVGLAAFL
ncbi:hypothetical protein N7540_006351 [Penicillium herquei]|nr:hypothetical protein N7540_006351 [Penicillium herquei]